MSEDKATPFGKYELLERLGAGGMANVYRARYTVAPGITKPVVIKRVLPEYAENPTIMEMFVHEARISVGLSHGNIVQVFDFGQVNGEYYLAMELVDGQPLSTVLKRAQALGMQNLPQPLAASIAIEICKGLHHAHARTDEQGHLLGLVHRDVSPDNVLVSYGGEVKLTDFGIAKVQLAGRPITDAGMVKGKYLYFSPEQAQGQDDLDARSDVYAVGVLLYRMLCGRLPFEGRDFEVLDRIVRGEVTPVLHLNPELDGMLGQIVMRALATSRGARFQSAEDLQQALSRWLATRAPLFTVTTLKHLMGWLHGQELKALGRPPVLPREFLDQVVLWCGAPIESGQRSPASAEETQPETPNPLSGPRRARASKRRETEAEMELEEGSGRGGRALGWALGLALTAVGLVLAALTLRGPKPVEIHSEPPGAQVRINGKILGATPLVVEDITPDALHMVELTLVGWKQWRRSFAVGTLTGKVEAELEEVEVAAPERADAEQEEEEDPPQPKAPTGAPQSNPPTGARASGGARLKVTAATKPSPEVATAKYKQGVKQLAKGQLENAKELFWQCLAHDAKSARCFRRLGEVSAALGNTEEALEYYARFLELEPRGEGANAARAYIRNQRHQAGK
ncbi:protein kinase domain-containing protein [Hyalangium sp.]|uniref:protein kinase domain-containing protein n=1 Tax=Hyalangium sp. TaxID=2028555 RepID=UPI002D5560F9|nr:protein kinase [Hyalangium sp.]HYH96764.1 protein kinase [Hyalangium sp.]